MFKQVLCSAVLAALLFVPAQAQEATVVDSSATQQSIRVSIKDGTLLGNVFTTLGESKTPLSGKVTLLDADGKTLTTSLADAEGNFMFTDVEPGQYKTVGVSGDYAGEKLIVISADGEEVASEDVASSGSFQIIPLEVGPAASSTIYNDYGNLPAASFSEVEVSSGCSTCGTSPVGSTVESFGGSCGCGGGGGAAGGGGGGAGGAFGSRLGGGFNFRRLALIGGITAIAVSAGNDDVATNDE